MSFKPMVLAGICGLLAACGGGSSGDGGDGGGGSSFEDVLSDFSSSSIFDESESEEFEPVGFADLEAAGSATYTGQSVIFLADDFADLEGIPELDTGSIDDLPRPSLAGEVNLQTTFSGESGTIEGSLNNFVDRDGNVKSGQLTLADGAIQNFGEVEGFSLPALFEANLEGGLSGSGLGSRDYEGEVFGLFTPDGVVGFGGDTLEDEGNDDASFGLVFVAED